MGIREPDEIINDILDGGACYDQEGEFYYLKIDKALYDDAVAYADRVKAERIAWDKIVAMYPSTKMNHNKRITT
jgi:hypothetical protein